MNDWLSTYPDKEVQLDLFGARASCQKFLANGMRLMLAALAYTLMQHLKRLAWKGTELERASSVTIRVRLLKMGAGILRNIQRIRNRKPLGNPRVADGSTENGITTLVMKFAGWLG